LPDYRIILDAVTDAYVAEKKIHLFVNSIKQNGSIERFRFQKYADLLIEKVPDTLTLADIRDKTKVVTEAGTETISETESMVNEIEVSEVEEPVSETE
jgi:hypothetical protein